MKPGTRIEVTVIGGPNEPAKIVRPRPKNLPIPAPGYHLVRFDVDGSSLFIHEKTFRVIDNR